MFNSYLRHNRLEFNLNIIPWLIIEYLILYKSQNSRICKYLFNVFLRVSNPYFIFSRKSVLLSSRLEWSSILNLRMENLPLSANLLSIRLRIFMQIYTFFILHIFWILLMIDGWTCYISSVHISHTILLLLLMKQIIYLFYAIWQIYICIKIRSIIVIIMISFQLISNWK